MLGKSFINMYATITASFRAYNLRIQYNNILSNTTNNLFHNIVVSIKYLSRCMCSNFELTIINVTENGQRALRSPHIQKKII